MGVSYEECEDKIQAAAEELFESDKRIRAVGISRHDGEYGFRAIRNSQAIVPLNLGAPPIQSFEGVPVAFRDTFGEVESLVILYAGNGAQTFACPVDTCLQALNCTLA